MEFDSIFVFERAERALRTDLFSTLTSMTANGRRSRILRDLFLSSSQLSLSAFYGSIDYALQFITPHPLAHHVC